MPLTKEQAAHLTQRIADRFSSQRYRPRDPKPAQVLKAEALVSAWSKEQEDKASEHARKLSALRVAAQEAVLAGDWPTALAAVKKFETTKI